MCSTQSRTIRFFPGEHITDNIFQANKWQTDTKSFTILSETTKKAIRTKLYTHHIFSYVVYIIKFLMRNPSVFTATRLVSYLTSLHQVKSYSTTSIFYWYWMEINQNLCWKQKRDLFIMPVHEVFNCTFDMNGTYHLYQKA